MIYKATNLIKQEMDKQEWSCSIKEYDELSDAIVGFHIVNGPTIQVHFLSVDDDNGVSVRVLDFIHHVAEDKEEKILRVINECNASNSYLKFVLDSENDVNVEYDFLPKTDDVTVGAEAWEMFIKCVDIINECYPLFMKAMWG